MLLVALVTVGVLLIIGALFASMWYVVVLVVVVVVGV
jgi:hypothetical protein